VQRHQSQESPILRQISSLIYPKIQRRQVIMDVLHPSCARPPRWSPPVLWRRFKEDLQRCGLAIQQLLTRRLETSSGLALPSVGDAANLTQSLAEHVVQPNKQIPTAAGIEQHVHFILQRNTHSCRDCSGTGPSTYLQSGENTGCWPPLGKYFQTKVGPGQHESQPPVEDTDTHTVD